MFQKIQHILHIFAYSLIKRATSFSASNFNFLEFYYSKDTTFFNIQMVLILLQINKIQL